MANGGIFNIVPLFSDEQGILTSGDCVEPVSSRLHPTFFHSYFSASSPDILELLSDGNVHYELEIGAVNDDALYYGDIYDVTCTKKYVTKGLA